MEQEEKSQIKKNFVNDLLPMILLGYVVNNGELHGYQAIKNIRKDFGVYLSTSKVYSQLGLLEKNGHLSCKPITPNGRKMKVYVPSRSTKDVYDYYNSIIQTIKLQTKDNTKFFLEEANRVPLKHLRNSKKQ